MNRGGYIFFGAMLVLLVTLGVLTIRVHASGSPLDRVDGWIAGCVSIVFGVAAFAFAIWYPHRSTRRPMGVHAQRALARRIFALSLGAFVLAAVAYLWLPNSASNFGMVALLTGASSAGVLHRLRRAARAQP